MMVMNYHELTMNEPRNSPAKRQQFLVICTIIATLFVYSCVTSGLFLSIDPAQGIFPGGNYIYKFAARDYAAAPSLARFIRKDDLQFTGPESVGDELMYYIYLDDPSRMGGRRQRFMTGMLMGTRGSGANEEKELEYMETLLSKNPGLLAKPVKKDEYAELSAMELWARLPYETADLPSVDSLVLHFPFTNGFVSALIAGYKVIPALRKLAVEKGEPGNVPVVISMCSIKDEMCTHYAPLVQGKDFLMGKPDTEEHQAKLGQENFIDLAGIKAGARKVFPWAKNVLDMLP